MVLPNFEGQQLFSYLIRLILPRPPSICASYCDAAQVHVFSLQHFEHHQAGTSTLDAEDLNTRCHLLIFASSMVCQMYRRRSPLVRLWSWSGRAKLFLGVRDSAELHEADG